MKLGLALICAALIAVIGRSAFDVPGELSPLPTAQPFVGVTAKSADDAPGAIDAKVATILERPVFSPDRRMQEPRAAVEVANIESELAPESMQNAAPRLAGIMTSSTGALALFVRGNGQYASVRAGAVIDGWTIARIERQSVVLLSMDRRLVVAPTAINPSPTPVTESSIVRVARRTAPGEAAARPIVPAAATERAHAQQDRREP
jgi:hypothetical protein